MTAEHEPPHPNTRHSAASPGNLRNPDNPYAAFWMGGFEGADHINGLGQVLDMADLNGHRAHLEEDHRRAAALGIGCVRETIGWRLAETAPGHFDLSGALRVAASARRHGLQVLWTLMHYGTPPDVSLLDDAAIGRFAAFAAAVAEALAPHSDAPPVYNPVNEISFLAWAVSHTDMMAPYRNDPRHEGADELQGTAASGYEVKRRLVRMALAGVDAMRSVDPRSRFLHVEPLVHVVAPRDQPGLEPLAEQIAGYQWQAWDMLSGRESPELGGEPRALDLIGINHYHSSQWEARTEERLAWHRRDARRRPFNELLQAAWQRYGRPMILAETSHFGDGRPQWLHEIASEVERARTSGLPVHGICLYPLIDRPDWSNLSQWHHSGLWDVAVEPPVPALANDPATTPSCIDGQPQRRVLCTEYAAALQAWQGRLPNAAARPPKPVLLVVSHLRWGFVHHRPQQLMTRLARHFHILFLEEPLPLGDPLGAARLDCIAHGPDIDLLLPRTPLDDHAGFSHPQLTTIAPLLVGFLREARIAEYSVWFYTPLALPLLYWLRPERVIFDCIDEMAAFDNSPPELPDREQALLRTADLVLTSGPALQAARQRPGRNVHCVPNGVDAAHFAPERLDFGSAQAVESRRRQGAGPALRLGYSGVIDERIDLDLVAALARAHPEWQIVMAGPVLKVDPARLPSASNILWLGVQPYVRLPYLIAGWAVCLMPFATHRITRFINPVKTLEYLAAGKPVVSTAVPDVVQLHAGQLAIAGSHAEFIAACEAALHEVPQAREARRAAVQQTLRESAWDGRVDQVMALLGALPSRGQALPNATPPELLLPSG